MLKNYCARYIFQRSGGDVAAFRYGAVDVGAAKSAPSPTAPVPRAPLQGLVKLPSIATNDAEGQARNRAFGDHLSTVELALFANWQACLKRVW